MKPQESSPQKRGEARFRAGLPCTVRIQGESYECSAHDLSRSGVQLVGGLPEARGEAVALRLATPKGDLTLDLTGTIAHIQAAEDGPRLGVRLDRIESEDDRAVLEALIARVIEGMYPAALRDLDENSTPDEIRTALDSVLLPHRVTLASRAPKKSMRDLIRHDTAGPVMEALVRNPHLSMTEMKTMLREMRLTPRAIEFVANDRRWNSDDEVKITLASHASVTLSVARQIVAKLNNPDLLRRLLQRPGLKPALRTEILSRIPERTLRGW